MIRLGIVGTGGMARSHAKAFGSMAGVRIVACCDIDEAKAAAFAQTFAIGAVYADWRAMLEREKLDAIANAAPDAEHAPISIAAARAGLHVMCEKPLAATLAEARRMVAAAKRAGIVTLVNFSYREAGALRHAARAIARGAIGRIMHVEASYLQSWLVSRVWGDWHETPAFLWRLSTAHGSTGVLGDIGSHIYDMASLLAGDITEIHCRLKTFEKGVPGDRIGPYLLDANDSFVSSVAFGNGALGTIHATRWATGQKNTLRVRVFGDRGGIDVDLDRSRVAYLICAGRRAIEEFAWREVACPPAPTMYERFIRAVRTGRPDPCDFTNGLKIQACLDASFASDALKRPVRVRLSR